MSGRGRRRPHRNSGRTSKITSSERCGCSGRGSSSRVERSRNRSRRRGRTQRGRTERAVVGVALPADVRPLRRVPGLIDPDDPAASEEYQEYFSLEAKREGDHRRGGGLDVESGAAFEREFSQYSSSIWDRLTELFELIDEGEEDLDIPPYNGGLFSPEDHTFLAENQVKDPYIAEVVFWLSTTVNDEGEHVPADYADLDTRHLGSIYEGLLEHEFRIAGPEGVAAVAEDGGQVWKSGDEVSVANAVETVDEGGLYVVNDEGERKATGAYYTPDYVVTYIVEETIDPLLDEIHEDLREEGTNAGRWSTPQSSSIGYRS